MGGIELMVRHYENNQQHKFDGEAHMYDTYYDSWDSHTIKVTDENIDQFKIVFDFREVVRVNDWEVDEYDQKDLYCVATDSGGSSCDNLYWIKGGTKKSRERLLVKFQEKVLSAKHNLETAERDLKKLLDGTHYLLKE